MTASEASNVITLNWTDNASNELGYIIERSTTSTVAGFLPVIYGGVGENVTTFVDSDIASNTTYYYRVRPVNSGCDSYSDVVTHTTGFIYCLPSYSSPCTGVNSILDNFSMDGDSGADEIENLGSNCSATSYDDFTAMSADVTEGNTYSFTACRNLSNSRFLEIWVDWNQDGDFDDGNEQMLNATISPNPCYTGSITVPASVPSGSTVMRLILANSSAPTNPCGSYSFGEAEDYTLNVTGTLPIDLISFEGYENEATIELSWITETEKDNDYFTLEKSADGIGFTEIIAMEGAGNSDVTLHYDFTDERPFFGKNYYRLKQTDFDGSFTYSEIIVINANSTDLLSVKIYPNPVRSDELHLSYSSISSGKIQIRIFDVMGKLVEYREVDTTQGNNDLPIQIEGLSEGIYFLQTTQKDFIRTVKFIRT